MRVLVTGGLGHLGSALTKELETQGNIVWVCDRRHSDRLRYVRCDVSQYRQVEQLFSEQGFDIVYHAAAEFGRKNGETFYEDLWGTNVIGNKNILRLQERDKFKLVFFSSSEVYGDYQGVMSEHLMDNIEIKQLNDYAISKWVGELQVLNSSKQVGTETVRVRLFNIYGPGEYYSPYRSAICMFVYHALHAIPYTVFTGHRRSWLYVDDTVRTLAKIVSNFIPGEVYNIGSTETYTMREVSDLVLSALGRDDSIVQYEEVERFTTIAKKVDVSGATRDLHHRTSVDLREGIRRTTDWMAKVYRRRKPRNVSEYRYPYAKLLS